MVHDLEPAKVFDVNGSKYRVGLDKYDYVQIQYGEVYEGDFYAFDSEKDINYALMFDPGAAEEIAEYIQELLNEHID